MLSKTFPPPPALRNILRCYHIRHFSFSPSQNAYKPYPARPEQSLVFYPRGTEVVEFADGTRALRPRGLLMGQYTERTNRHIADEILIIIAELQPGAAAFMLHENMSRLVNKDVDLNDILPVEMDRLMYQLHQTTNYALMLDAINQFLLSNFSLQISNEHPVDKVARYMLSHSNNMSLDWLADQACLSARQFERRFKEHLGIGPKTYLRLIRLHESYKLKALNPAMNWLDIALACGYCDYQHLVKDYKAFANSSPVSLMSEQSSAPEKLFGLEETFS